MVDLAAQRIAHAGVDAEQRLGQVAGDGVDAVAAAEALDQRFELLGRPLADEHVDVALALEQPFDQMAADEAGGPRHEVARHVFPLPRCLRSASESL